MREEVPGLESKTWPFIAKYKLFRIVFRKLFAPFSVGTGKVHLENLTADEVEVRMESDGDVILKGGVVERLRANLRGKGSLQAIDLPALRAHVFISLGIISYGRANCQRISRLATDCCVSATCRAKPV